MTRNGAKKSCQPRCVHSWQTERRLLWFKTSKVKIGSMAFIYDTGGINSQLRAHSILSPFVTCTFCKKFPAEFYVAVYLKVLSMQLLSHRGRMVASSESKKATVFFSSRKGLLWNYCQQKTFSSDKTYSFILYILLCFYWSYWGFFNKENLIC